MVWPLGRVIKETEDTAYGLVVFKTNVAEFRPDISNCMSICYQVTTSFHVLENCDCLRHDVRSDLDLVIPSLMYTLGTCRDAFAVTDPSAYYNGQAARHYRIIWLDLQSAFMREGMNLLGRLALYARFIEGIVKTARGHHRAHSRDMEKDRARLDRLLLKQEGDPEDTAKSYQFTLPPLAINRRPINFSHVPASYPPPIPEPAPLSPTYSNSSSQSFSTTHTYGTGSGSLLAEPNHWARRIFDGQHPVHPLPYDIEPTRCYGTHQPGLLLDLHRENSFKVLELPFESSSAKVLLFYRVGDKRARIVFTEKGQRERHWYIMALSSLTIRRAGSALQLRRINQYDGKHDIWARLKFSCHERMVLLFCVIVAMKMQDPTLYPMALDEFPLQGGESLCWSGEIQNENLRHIMRIWRDFDSSCLRIEVTPKRGRMKVCPIWTAFLNEYVNEPGWVKRINPSVVYLRKLHPYIFHETYGLRFSTTGWIKLEFTYPDDADALMDVWDDICAGRI
ncbi:hypothetical protein EJ05DRAFT_251606 [Pseudovirgaria hyperparasitica]|uniref:Uncharacterized protein n=1 Tax=Pseudovirgaria hyperparasitica TaxID=470096 RepID=A0A6A6WEW2_9PEZI|nr:uncharacterized protein EJ05DRAFT_251606 [Pseudovirgaria hyperparasitica]KAF2761075.1 hypothetical protein EJ05DRAFT_251606 [Pseudovirgaria hyperparasitica]